MKWVTISVLAILLVAGAILQNIFLDEFSSRMRSACDDLQEVVADEDYAKAQDIFKNIENIWEHYSIYLGALVEHTEIDSIEEKLRSVKWGIQTQDEVQLPANISQLRYYCAHVHMVDAFSIRNIF